MCFDSGSSLLAWSLALSISYYLYHRNRRFDRWNAAFIMTFTLIQLLEAGLWQTIGPDGVAIQSRRQTNELLTKMVLLALLLQPLVQSAMARSYSPSSSSSSSTLKVLVIMFVAFLAYGFLRVLSASSGQFTTHRGHGGHLIWNDSANSSFLGGFAVTALYLFGLFAGLALVQGMSALPLIAIGAATAMYSLATRRRGSLEVSGVSRAWRMRW